MQTRHRLGLRAVLMDLLARIKVIEKSRQIAFRLPTDILADLL